MGTEYWLPIGTSTHCLMTYAYNIYVVSWVCVLYPSFSSITHPFKLDSYTVRSHSQKVRDATSMIVAFQCCYYVASVCKTDGPGYCPTR